MDSYRTLAGFDLRVQVRQVDFNELLSDLERQPGGKTKALITQVLCAKCGVEYIGSLPGVIFDLILTIPILFSTAFKFGAPVAQVLRLRVAVINFRNSTGVLLEIAQL